MDLPKKRPKPSTVSFIDELEEPIKAQKFNTNPNTLPEIFPKDSQLLEEIKQNYKKEMKKDGLEQLELTFTYWDGTNAKKTVTVNKCDTVGEFLFKAKELLKIEYPSLEQSHSLMFVKEDKIVPHEYKFQDLLESEAHGKKGPLFSVVKTGVKWQDTGYTIKILERKWYEKNKHIFPASRWTIYEPD